jgi:hypothetical protein
MIRIEGISFLPGPAKNATGASIDAPVLTW